MYTALAEPSVTRRLESSSTIATMRADFAVVGGFAIFPDLGVYYLLIESKTSLQSPQNQFRVLFKIYIRRNIALRIDSIIYTPLYNWD